MKPIESIINKISEKELKGLAKILKIKKISVKEVLKSLTSYSGFELLLDKLDENELKLLKLIYKTKKPITFGEIEKKLNFENDLSETISNSLSKKLLLHSIKNRQLLNKKFDKIFPIQEISAIANFTNNGSLQEHLNKLKIALKNQSAPSSLSLKDQNQLNFLAYLINIGGIISFKEAQKEKSFNLSDEVLTEMIDKELIILCQNIDDLRISYLILNPKNVLAILKVVNRQKKSQKISYVNNNYCLLTNMLKTFDVISTFGLFLTKKTSFRIVDLNRIYEVMINLQTIEGNLFPVETTADLSLFLLKKIECLRIYRDTANVNLKKIKNNLSKPEVITKKILEVFKIFNEKKSLHPALAEPFPIPTFEDMISFIEYLHQIKKISYERLKIIVILKSLVQVDKKNLTEQINRKAKEIEERDNLLNFLCLLGIIKNENNVIKLTDIGESIVELILNLKSKSSPKKEIDKNIYINPDFTIFIPRRDVPSAVLYHLLFYSDLKKDDLLIQSIVSEESIAKAHRRGGDLSDFQQTLEKFVKNEIPQNFKFLLKEWSKHTISLEIFHTILLKVNQPDFLDELVYNKTKKISSGIIERLTPNYAIIKNSYIDAITKFARDKRAMISLFENLSSADKE